MKNKYTYTTIVFLQGDEADEVLQILEDEGEQAAMNYLAQWDYGDSSDVSNSPPWGADDDLYREGNYIMSYNSRIGYIGLCLKERNHD